MKGFSYIVRHGMLIVLVIGISIAYVYRQQLFPRFFDDQVHTQVNTGESNETVHAESLASEQTEMSPEKSAIQSGDKNNGAVSDQYVESTDQADQSTQTEDTLSVVPEDTKKLIPVPSGESDNIKKDVEQPSQLQPAPSASLNSKENHELSSDEQQKPDVGNTNSPGSDDTIIDSRYTQEEQYFQIINNARHAFWQGQHDVAITRYEQAILHLPASVEAYGELGNVYYSMGRWDESGENLYQAAIRLVDAGQTQRAQYLLSVISGLKPARIKDLEKKLAEKK